MLFQFWEEEGGGGGSGTGQTQDSAHGGVPDFSPP